MAASSFISWSPLLGAAPWLAVAVYLGLRHRYRTWTEVFFIGVCASTAAYALCDVIFFNLSDPNAARIAASASLASLSFTAFFVFLYGVTLWRRFRGPFLLALVPVAFFVIAFPAKMFTGFDSLSGDGNPPFVPVYDPAWLYPWILLLVALTGTGMYGILRTFLEIRRLSPKLARHIGLTLLGLGIAAVAGSVTNAYFAVMGNPVPPLFSTALVLPGVLIGFAVTPTTYQRLNAVLLRRKATQYDIKGAFLTFTDGTLIGSKLAPEQAMIDPDAFGATLDVIQNFMHTSFPTLRGKWLKSIRHGDYTLVMERGRHTFLTLVLGGRENDQLRREIIEALSKFEQVNREVLENWRGIAKDARGADEMLESLLASS